MSWYALDVLDDALDETKSLLLPFDLGRWIRLAIITFFVGAGGQPTMSFQFDQNTLRMIEAPTSGLPETGQLILLIAVLAALLGVVFTFIGSVMEFVLVDVVRSRDVRVREPFSRRLGAGLRLFGFRLALLVIVLIGVLVIVAPIIVTGFMGGGAGAAPLLLLLVMMPFFFVFVLVVALVHEFTTAFVVPLMIEYEQGVIATWRSFWPELRTAWKQFAVYVLVRFGLGILAGMILGAVGGILFLPLIAGAGFSLLTGGMPSALLLVGFAVAFGVLTVLVTVFVQMPVTTYLRYYSLSVLDASEVEFTIR